MEPYPASELSRTRSAATSCERYLDRLRLAPSERRDLLLLADDRDDGDRRAAMVRLHRTLAGYPADPVNPVYASVRRRLDLAYGTDALDDGQLVVQGAGGRTRLAAAPPVNRTTMAPGSWPPSPVFRQLLSARARGKQGRERDERQACPDAPKPVGRWHRAGAFRRWLLLALVLSQTTVAIHFMSAVLPYHGQQPLEMAILVLFGILFCWVSAGFWTAIMGFIALARAGDRYAISRTATGDGPLTAQARTAVVMPICNENVQRAFAGLRATYESLRRTGELAHFDFFVLSDTSDPDARVAEIHAWLEMRRTIGGTGQVFYRRRKHRLKRKSGNVADFCRRWGANYRYMVVLDADSVMTGECLTKLARLMEANPGAGIIQTAPRAAGRDTLHARIQQFASRVYGPLFTAGLHYWQLGESHYWGHNAIIRVAPFIRHCALGRLPGRGALSGDILSHDFVEAALMRRAGWAVWIAYDLPGSYEEMPPNLVDEVQRDRRWCRGNLMNSRLFLAEGLHPAHRAVFMTGLMAYLSAPLWFLFLMLATALLAVHTLVPPKYFVQPYQLFPLWPEWRPEWAIGLFTATSSLLFVPKILSVLLVWAGDARRFGGRMRVAAGMVAELIVSALLAPIRMLFHTQFVVSALVGWSGLHWKSPPRENAETSWRDALRRHGLHTLFGIAWACGVYSLNPTFLWWLAPVVGALVLSIPISVYTSRVGLGDRLRKASLFLVPEESQPPQELVWVYQGTDNRAATAPGFVEAVVEPGTNALACAAAVARPGQLQAVRTRHDRLAREALVHGPDSLTDARKAALLADPVVLSELHLAVWTSAQAHPDWLKSIAAEDKRG